jgi:hypothetical protein
LPCATLYGYYNQTMWQTDMNTHTESTLQWLPVTNLVFVI